VTEATCFGQEAGSSVTLNPTCYINNTSQLHVSLYAISTIVKLYYRKNMNDKVNYLLSLGAVRDRAKVVGEAAQAGKLTHFDVHEERLGSAADFVTSVIKVCFYLPTRVVLFLFFQSQKGSFLASVCLLLARFRARQVPYDSPAWALAAL